MNVKKLAELILFREAQATVVPFRRKIIEPFMTEFAAGRKPDFKKLVSAIRRVLSQTMLQLLLKRAVSYPPSMVLKTALAVFKGQEDLLEDFIRRYGLALDRGIKPAHDDFDGFKAFVLVLWQDGFGIFPARVFPARKRRVLAAHMRTLPPLSRWNGKAAWQFLKMAIEPGLSHETWRKRVNRWGLHQVEPILVQKFKNSSFPIVYTPEGMQWLRENHSLDLVTRNGKKMSQDMETLARFNTANGSGGKITVQRARMRRVRSGQRTPANNSPDLHSIAAATSAMSLDRIQPKRAR
jgi:hypothetical protein